MYIKELFENKHFDYLGSAYVFDLSNSRVPITTVTDEPTLRFSEMATGA
jgi:hypothetical protein